jgi:hypothetical protein
MNGKGSKQRPRQVGGKEFADNWDRVFATPCCGKPGKCGCDDGPVWEVKVSEAMMPFWPIRRVR